MTSREVSEGPQVQGVDEELNFTITTTNWGSNPSSVTMVVKDASNSDADVTNDVTSGSTSVSGDVITLKTILDLTAGHRYRVEVKFTSGGSIFEPYFYIRAEE